MKNILCIILAIVLTALLCPCAAAEAADTDEADAGGAALLTPRELLGLEAEPSPAWAAAVAEQTGAEQVFIVAAHEKTTAWVSMHEKDENGEWRMILSTPGYIGRSGLGKQREGDGKTPVGVFSFNRAFGIAEDPGCAIPYVQADEDTYWSCDQRRGMRYNELVSLEECPQLDKTVSEHIVDCVYEFLLKSLKR